MYTYFERQFSDNAILLVDHGIIQNIVSFGYVTDFGERLDVQRDVLMHLLTNKHTVVIINCNAPIDTALLQIRQRASQHGRIPGINDDAIRDALKVQMRNFHLLRNFALETENIHNLQLRSDGTVDELSTAVEAVYHAITPLLPGYQNE
jgi:hypothetical protein